MKRGDSVRIRKTDIMGTVTGQPEPHVYMVDFPVYGIPVMCHESEIELFPNDDVLAGMIAQSYAEAVK